MILALKKNTNQDKGVREWPALPQAFEELEQPGQPKMIAL
jgi:hypothetical protein